MNWKPCFNPRTPCGVRHEAGFTGGDFELFQSTHSLRSATQDQYQLLYLLKVSIHALLAECDSSRSSGFFQYYGFNPRTPCGVRPTVSNRIQELEQFQSTHSLRSATRASMNIDPGAVVSIHALLAECDLAKINNVGFTCGFNPRTPCGVRPFWYGLP